MTYTSPIILASGSRIRAAILENAGVPFSVKRPEVDESAIKEESHKAGLSIDEIAMRLARTKALAINAEPEALVIGADQILEFNGEAYDKPTDLEEAAKRLLSFSGKAHHLVNAVSIVRDREVVWSNLERPALYMRQITRSEIEAYIDEAGADILSSVGAYQVEKLGARLFDRIEGDYFAVLGMSLYPLLNFLRAEGALPY